MSAAVAMAPSPAPHERRSFASELQPSSKAASVSQSAAPSPSSAQTKTLLAISPPASAANNTASRKAGGSHSPRGNNSGAVKSSPSGASRTDAKNPKIVVKKELGSPTLSTTRPRPRRLDLSKNSNFSTNMPTSAVPVSARDNLGIQEVGIACLSPGFVTQDPIMKEQLQRSIYVREQQRHIIEARLLQQSAKGDGPSDKDKDAASQFAVKTPGMSRRNKAPPGLSIVAPSHEQFANERAIQSAPLGHSFTVRQHPGPLSRHVVNQPSNLSSTSHIHHVPANQTSNRLPPLSDVFRQSVSAHPENTNSSLNSINNSALAPRKSPSHLPSHQLVPTSGRPREFKSAEEAQQELAGGRPELLPRLVHYTGHQPPTPQSPVPGSRQADGSRSTSRRRTRAEYEEGGSPPLGHGPAPSRYGPFGEGRDSPEVQRQKKNEFMSLCSRAWDLFHS